MKQQTLRPAVLLLQHRYFLVNIAKFLRTAFFIEHLWWLFLKDWLQMTELFNF